MRWPRKPGAPSQTSPEKERRPHPAEAAAQLADHVEMCAREIRHLTARNEGVALDAILVLRVCDHSVSQSLVQFQPWSGDQAASEAIHALLTAARSICDANGWRLTVPRDFPINKPPRFIGRRPA